MQIILIAAMTAQGRVIGSHGTIPWHYSEDLRHFKRVTTGYPIVMGSKTFASLNNKPLPNRQNIILTRKSDAVAHSGEIICNTVEQVFAKLDDAEKVFIIGGAEIYRLFMPFADQMILTVVKQEYLGDTYFPEFDLNDWRIIEKQEYPDFDIIYLENNKNKHQNGLF